VVADLIGNEYHSASADQQTAMRSPIALRRLTWFFVLSLVACSPTPRYVINQPADGGSFVCSDPAGMACTVQIDVQWDGVSVRPHPEATFDGAPLPGTFTTSGKSSVATVTAAVGSHTLVVSGDLMAKGTVATYSATSTFGITSQPPPTGGFSISANPSDLLIERGKSATTTISVTRSPPFAGAVTVALTNPPAGITMAPVTTMGPTATVTIATAAAAAHGKVTLAVGGTAAGVPNAGTPLRVTVGREPGPFAEANPTPYTSTLPSSKSALAGGFRVDIATGAPSLPQPRKATFYRGTVTVGNEIGFTLGPTSNLGGAGFCANSLPLAITRGVVLSGALPGYASQNVITFVDLTVTAPRQIEATAEMTVQHTSTSPLITFQPRVFFSRDCTLALVAGANKLGPSQHVLTVYDLISGQPIGAEVPFETATFSALVRTAGTRQEVEILVDTGAPTAQTVVYNVP
jgi:hypothetical protein